ncbi:MAG TPA: hypothetical protein ENH05_02935, partial [Rhizobiales bacterium]|nr:hypothetical protein [Hyphomicrobiales bacterium]
MTTATDVKAAETGTHKRRLMSNNDSMIFAGLVLFGILGPILFPNYTFQIAVLWLMVLFALTWDIMGGQMGYNSLGNIFFFGAGMYICAIVQVGLFTDVGAYTSVSGQGNFKFTPDQYYIGVAVGLVAAAIGSSLLAVALGWIVFGLRGPYFAIGT